MTAAPVLRIAEPGGTCVRGTLRRGRRSASGSGPRYAQPGVNPIMKQRYVGSECSRTSSSTLRLSSAADASRSGPSYTTGIRCSLPHGAGGGFASTSRWITPTSPRYVTCSGS